MYIQVQEISGPEEGVVPPICDVSWSENGDDVLLDLDDGGRNVFVNLTVQEAANLVSSLVDFLADKARKAVSS